MGRKAFPTTRLLWLLLALYIAAIIGLIFFGKILNDRLAAVGIPYGTELLFVSAVLLFCAGFWGLRRLHARQLKTRVDFDEVVRLIQDDSGLRFATENIEYYLKWPGISQLLMVQDGVVVSHGAMFFLIPDSAFAGDGDRLAFIREVYGRLSEKARSISEKHVRPALSHGEQPSAA